MRYFGAMLFAAMFLGGGVFLLLHGYLIAGGFCIVCAACTDIPAK